MTPGEQVEHRKQKEQAVPAVFVEEMLPRDDLKLRPELTMGTSQIHSS